VENWGGGGCPKEKRGGKFRKSRSHKGRKLELQIETDTWHFPTKGAWKNGIAKRHGCKYGHRKKNTT